jgi:hypothetical protein
MKIEECNLLIVLRWGRGCGRMMEEVTLRYIRSTYVNITMYLHVQPLFTIK